MPADSRSISLRHRFHLVAFALVVLIVILTTWSQISLHSIRSQVNSSLDNRHDLLEKTHKIRNYLLIAYRSTDGYLLDPAQKQLLPEVNDSIKQAIEHSLQLQEYGWLQQKKQNLEIVQLISSLKKLQDDINLIITVRDDVNQQYPAMAVANQDMQSPRRGMDNAMLIVFSEFENEKTITSHPSTYKKFVELQRMWSQMLSIFRLYLANRIGSFSESAIPIQEISIETIYFEMQDLIIELEKQTTQPRLGFESSAALEDIKKDLKDWFRGFKKVQIIHASGEWRMDSTLMKTRVIPLVDQINNQLRNLETYIHENVDEDVNTYSQLAQTHRYLLLIITISSVAVIFFIIWLSNHYLFKPLSTLANILRTESTGKQSLEIPTSRVLETQKLVEAFIEMRHQVRIRQNELEYRALHDGLTSLPNRALLMDHIKHDLTMAKRESKALGLMFIDLDRFKEINDTLGHLVGDQVLVEVGRRFQSSLRDSDTVARLGGDEFAVLMPNTDLQGTKIIANNILESLTEPVMVNDMQLHVNASIGIALYPQHGEDTQTLMQHADVAMYEAKQNQTGLSVYNPDEDQYSLRRLALVNDLQTAIDNSEFELHYQPIISLRADSTSSQAEALLRWNTNKHGDIAPELIINLAEQTALIRSLTDWVIDQSLYQTKLWRDEGIDFYVSVNLSMYNLREEDLAEKIHRALLKYDLPSHVLTLEITESAMMFNPGHVIKILNQLSKMGVKLSIDDFGTGFSSLAYLKQLPVNQIKIDKSFISDLANDVDDQTIVKTTINLAENLGLSTIIEGVEDEEALKLLKEYGCQYVQGYLLSRPLPAEEYREFITRGKEPV